MLVQKDTTKIAGIYSTIFNNTNGILYNNKITGVNYDRYRNLSINSKLINDSSIINTIVINSQFLYNNMKQQFNYNSFYNFDSNVSGSRTSNIYLETLTIKNDDTQLAKFSNIFIPIYYYNNIDNNGYKWLDLTSYSTIIFSGNIKNTQLSSSFNFMQAKQKSISIIVENFQDSIVNFSNLYSFYGNININNIYYNNISLSIIFCLSSISNLTLNINTSNISNILYNNIQNCTITFNNNINNKSTLSENNRIFNSKIYYINIVNENNMFNNQYILNTDFIINNSNISYKYIHTYNTDIYNGYAFIDLNTINVINIDNKYNNIFLNTYNNGITISYKQYSNNIINNNSLYVLDAHAHVVQTINEDVSNLLNYNLPAQIFPIQTISQHITHSKTTNNSRGNVTASNNKSVYLPVSAAIGTTYIPENSLLPIGSIVGWCQILKSNKWVPSVPYGFYQLKTSTYDVLVDCDNPRSIRYNGELEKLYGSKDQKITLPKITNDIYYNGNNARIIYILKYSDNCSYTQNRIQFEQQI